MKRLLLILILTFISQSLTKADDISDFQIEGISIGDSLSDYFSKEMIEKEKALNFDMYKDKEYFMAWFDGNGRFKNYDYLQIHLKTNDKNYIVRSIEGKIIYKDNIKDCYSKKNKILNELKLIFPNSTIDNVKRKHVADPSKKSSTDTTYLYFNNKSGNAGVACYDWSSELVHLDNLKVFIDTDHFLNWLSSRAYK
jgi:hypothetical protein